MRVIPEAGGSIDRDSLARRLQVVRVLGRQVSRRVPVFSQDRLKFSLELLSATKKASVKLPPLACRHLSPLSRAIMRTMPRRKPLDSLMPLDDLKKVVAGLARVPKDAIGKPEPKQPKRKAKP
jgi:hypothetical protein